VFEYALLPHDGGCKTAGLPQRCAEYLNPCVAMEFGKGNRDGGLPLESASLLQLDKGTLSFRGIKRSEDSSSLVVRLYNPSDTAVTDTLTLFGKPAAVQEVRLDETPVRELPIEENGEVALAVGPYELLTLTVNYGG